jgi:hypothetical protein
MFALSVVLEATLPLIPKQRDELRYLMSAFAIGIITALSCYVLILDISILSVLLGCVSLYRIVNILRALKARMHPSYLKRVCLRTTVWLAGTQAELYLLRHIWDYVAPSPEILWTGVACLQLVIGTLVYLSVRKHRKHAAASIAVTALSDKHLPSVTVAVAARNETDELLRCIESVLASDYPKLEVLVLDDCSQNRRTSEIIRSFAHRGVRFIPGGDVDDSWLARNHSYDTLAKAASGAYILFCSTSLELEPTSLRRMVSYAVNRQKSMLSVLPRNDAPNIAGWFLESMRTAWELMPPRRWLGRPPVASACWLIAAKSLRQAGGFAAARRMIVPEAYFAGRLIEGDQYSFIPGGGYLGVASREALEGQHARIVRINYPSLHRKPESVALTAAALIGIGILPFAQVFSILAGRQWLLPAIISFATALLLVASYHCVLVLSRQRVPKLASLLFPATILAALWLQHVSMYKYEFREVIWKERNVCVPVMHVTPHLPKI